MCMIHGNLLVMQKKNIVTAKYCHNVIDVLINKMKVEHKEWQDNINQQLINSIQEKRETSVPITKDGIPKFELDVLGMSVGYTFLIDKYIKDFFQYVRNTFESIAQIVNSALLGNESKDIEWVDFNKLFNFLGTRQSDFPKTYQQMGVIKNSDEFSYVSEFNNRIKHVCDAKITMSMDLFGDGVTSDISSFYKKGTQFSNQDILDITSKVMIFAENELANFMKVLTKEIELDLNVKGRIHQLSFDGQQIKDDPENSFVAIYTGVESSIDELPEFLRVLLINNNENIISGNCDYEEILVRNKAGDYVGRFVLTEPINEDGLLTYRCYKKGSYDGIKTFFDHVRKNNHIKVGLMSGKLIRVGFD